VAARRLCPLRGRSGGLRQLAGALARYKGSRPPSALGSAAGPPSRQVEDLPGRGRRYLPGVAHFPRSHPAGASERGPVSPADAENAGLLCARRNPLGTGDATNPGMARACCPRGHMEATRDRARRVLLYRRAACDLKCGAVRGTTIQRIFARPTATGINLTTGTITSGSVVSGMWSGRRHRLSGKREPERSRPLWAGNSTSGSCTGRKRRGPRRRTSNAIPGPVVAQAKLGWGGSRHPFGGFSRLIDLRRTHWRRPVPRAGSTSPQPSPAAPAA